MVLISRRLEAQARGPKKGLGLATKILALGLDKMVLVLRIKSCNFQESTCVDSIRNFVDFVDLMMSK